MNGPTALYPPTSLAELLAYFVINPPRGFTINNTSPHIPFVVALTGVPVALVPPYSSTGHYLAQATLHPSPPPQVPDNRDHGGQYNVQGSRHRENLLWRPEHQAVERSSLYTTLYFVFDNIQPTHGGLFKLLIRIVGPGVTYGGSVVDLNNELSAKVYDGSSRSPSYLRPRLGIPSTGQMRVFNSLLSSSQIARLPRPMQNGSGEPQVYPWEILWEISGYTCPTVIRPGVAFPKFIFRVYGPRNTLRGINVNAFVVFRNPDGTISSINSCASYSLSQPGYEDRVYFQFPRGFKLRVKGVWKVEIWVNSRPASNYEGQFQHYPLMRYQKLDVTVQ
ncbi:hypothetical protein QBC43DRAFT_286132 [Cladorrhinum sp. PSN259]|nr:hypothetical protein QBC43DRAFT_286132 [Cladorrhinum sp. PSN259]